MEANRSQLLESSIDRLERTVKKISIINLKLRSDRFVEYKDLTIQIVLGSNHEKKKRENKENNLDAGV